MDTLDATQTALIQEALNAPGVLMSGADSVMAFGQVTHPPHPFKPNPSSNPSSNANPFQPEPRAEDNCSASAVTVVLHCCDQALENSVREFKQACAEMTTGAAASVNSAYMECAAVMTEAKQAGATIRQDVVDALNNAAMNGNVLAKAQIFCCHPIS